MLHACLYTICFVFCYTSWRFYAFSRTNLLTRCHSASSQFSAIFVFQKSYTGNILRIRRNKSRSSYFSRHETESKAEMEGHGVARPAPSQRHQVVWPPGPPPDAALPPIYSPQRANLKPNQFPRNILQAATIIDARSGGSQSSSRHPAREGNHHRRPSSSSYLPLGVPNWADIYMPSSNFSGAVVWEKEDFCKGSLSLPIFYFVIVFLYFCLHLFIKNTKN
jgi:hypothetical protein